MFHHAGLAIWDNDWYGGHHVPAYSILFPPLAGILGPRVVGALAAVAAAWAFERLVVGARGATARPAAWWFAAATVAPLVSGRLTFILGTATALGALVALARGRAALAGGAAVATALASPVAAAFLALALLARMVVHPRGRDAVLTTALVAAALLPVGALYLLFPEGGDFPFAASAFWPSLATTMLVLAALPRFERSLRAGTLLYAVLLVAAMVLSTAMGGNAVRLGAYFAGPMAAFALWPRRRVALALLAPFLLYWQWTTPVDDWIQGSADASVRAPYYVGLVARLDAAGGPPFRVEIPFTDNHWESAQVATHVPLARGWERQLDRKVNGLFYDGKPLTAARYRRWLDANAVRFVALPDAPIDPSGAAEAALVRRGTPYLREVWHDAHWRLFAVSRPAPLARGATVTALGPDSVTLQAPRAGRVRLRVHYTPYWRLTEGRGCVAPDGDWTVLRVTRPGRIVLRTSFAVGRIRATSARCTT